MLGVIFFYIENAILDIIDFDNIINDFVSRNVRRCFFVREKD